MPQKAGSAQPRAFQSYLGVDLHQCTVTLFAVDAAGKELQALKLSTKSVLKIEDWLLSLPRPSALAVEACPFVEWFIERYRACVDRIEIADATALKQLRGKRRKTDRNDARDIAQRFARGECPLGFIAGPELMQLRKLGRHWRQLSRLLARTKHAMKSLLHAANLRAGRFDGAAAQRWLLAHGRHLMRDADRRAFANYLEVVQLVERQRQTLRIELLTAERSDAFRRVQRLLETVPGIGSIWSLMIAAEIGPFDRFPCADALEFWAGLTPDVQESAGRRQAGGNITKAGSAPLRWALCQAAMTLCQSDAGQEAIRQRLIARMPRPKANVAMGRRLLRTLYAMVRDGAEYRRGEPRDRTRAANAAKARRKARQARPAAKPARKRKPQATI